MGIWDVVTEGMCWGKVPLTLEQTQSILTECVVDGRYHHWHDGESTLWTLEYDFLYKCCLTYVDFGLQQLAQHSARTDANEQFDHTWVAKVHM